MIKDTYTYGRTKSYVSETWTVALSMVEVTPAILFTHENPHLFKYPVAKTAEKFTNLKFEY